MDLLHSPSPAASQRRSPNPLSPTNPFFRLHPRTHSPTPRKPHARHLSTFPFPFPSSHPQTNNQQPTQTPQRPTSHKTPPLSHSKHNPHLHSNGFLPLTPLPPQPSPSPSHHSPPPHLNPPPNGTTTTTTNTSQPRCRPATKRRNACKSTVCGRAVGGGRRWTGRKGREVGVS